MIEWLSPYSRWTIWLLLVGIVISLWVARRTAQSKRLRSARFFFAAFRHSAVVVVDSDESHSSARASSATAEA